MWLTVDASGDYDGKHEAKRQTPLTRHGKPRQMPRQTLANATATKSRDFKMTEHQTQKDINTSATNLVPFPATPATYATRQTKLYTADDLRMTFAPMAKTNRTVRDLVAKVREAYHWLPEIDFKYGDEYTQFCFDQIKAMKDSPMHQKQWVLEIQKQSPVTQTEPKATTQSALTIANNPTDLFSQIVNFTPATQTTQQVETIECEILDTETATGDILSEFVGAIELSKTKADELEQKQRLEDAKLVKQRLQAEITKRNKVKRLDNQFADMNDEELARLAQMAGLASPKSPVGNGLGV